MIQEGYEVFFYQIILPMCDLGRSLIRGDPSNAHYYEVDNLSNIYGVQLGMCESNVKSSLTYLWMSWLGSMGW